MFIRGSHVMCTHLAQLSHASALARWVTVRLQCPQRDLPPGDLAPGEFPQVLSDIEILMQGYGKQNQLSFKIKNI